MSDPISSHSPPDWPCWVNQAAQGLLTQHSGERLTKATELVLNDAVTLYPDGATRVQSDDKSYRINSDCPCNDAQYHIKYCNHYPAVELQKIALDLMNASQHYPATSESSPPSQPSASYWAVTEARSVCTLKFQISGVDILYTMRDVNDTLFARIKRDFQSIQNKLQMGKRK